MKDLPVDPSLDSGGLDSESLELAALYALSALSAPEMAEVERDYRDRSAFWAEVRSLRDAAAGLAEAGPRARPGRDLWPAIRARVRGTSEASPCAQLWKQWPTSESGERVVRAADGAFEPTDIEGISVRRLFVDAAADRVSMLIRMAPGTSYPEHRHAGVEECYVLEGDLWIGSETEMRAGDFQRMERDSVHARQGTRGGCLLLIHSSRHDELVG